MGRKHTDALKEKSKQIAALGQRVYITTAPKDAVMPYLVWHPARGTNQQAAVTGPRVIRRPRFTGHIVAATAEQVEVITDLLEELLMPHGRGIVIDVDGEKSYPLSFDAPLPIQAAKDPQPTIAYQVIEVGWTSQPRP